MLSDMHGVVYGIRLSYLVPGQVYDLPRDIAEWVISQRKAEEVPRSTHAFVVPLDNPRAFEQLTRGVSVDIPAAVAHDRPPRRKKAPVVSMKRSGIARPPRKRQA